MKLLPNVREKEPMRVRAVRDLICFFCPSQFSLPFLPSLLSPLYYFKTWSRAFLPFTMYCLHWNNCQYLSITIHPHSTSTCQTSGSWISISPRFLRSGYSLKGRPLFFLMNHNKPQSIPSHGDKRNVEDNQNVIQRKHLRHQFAFCEIRFLHNNIQEKQ